MTSPSLDHIRALVLALPQGGPYTSMSGNLRRRFQQHRRFHYRRRPESFYPGTHAQQQFDFDFINTCEMEEWHPYNTGGWQTRWRVPRTRGSCWIHEVTTRGEMARQVALKGNLEVVVEGVERVKKVWERVCLDCDEVRWGRCICDEE